MKFRTSSGNTSPIAYLDLMCEEIMCCSESSQSLLQCPLVKEYSSLHTVNTGQVTVKPTGRPILSSPQTLKEITSLHTSSNRKGLQQSTTAVHELEHVAL